MSGRWQGQQITNRITGKTLLASFCGTKSKAHPLLYIGTESNFHRVGSFDSPEAADEFMDQLAEMVQAENG